MSEAEDFERIQALSANVNFLKKPLDNRLYFNRWQVAWMISKQPFEQVLSLFFYCMSFLSGQLNLQKISRITAVLSKQMQRNWHQLSSQWEFEKKLLVPAFNAHLTSPWSLYTLNNLAIKEIGDNDALQMTHHQNICADGVKKAMLAFFQQLSNETRKVYSENTILEAIREFETTLKEKNLDAAIERLKSQYKIGSENAINKLYRKIMKWHHHKANEHKNISFYYPNGICRGDSMWYIYLYLRTERLFSDPQHHRVAVAEQLKSGVPTHGVILQALGDAQKLLGMKKTSCPENSVSLYELDTNRGRALEKIEALEPGTYRVGTYHHSLVYKKTATSHELFDPSFGEITLDSAKEFLDHILKYDHRMHDPASHILFERWEIAENVQAHRGVA